MKVLNLLLLVQLAYGANILYLSNIPSPSHFIWCKAILTSLHKQGHNITALSPDVEGSIDNFSYYHLEKIYPAIYNGTEEFNFFEMGQKSTFEMLFEFLPFFETSCIATLESEGYKQLLNYPESFKFDLVIFDFTMSQCILGLVHKFKYPPMISVSPFLFSSRYSILAGSLIYPAFAPAADGHYTQKMTFSERLETTIQCIFEIVFEKFYTLPINNKFVQKVHPGAPSVDEIEMKATKMIFLNAHPMMDYMQPIFPNVKLVGGAQIQQPKTLPEDLKQIADNAKNGLVLFSLGTNVRSDTLGDERIVNIIKAFERHSKYTFLWKFETSEKLPIELPKNVKIRSWIPQNDILGHPNTKLFISHCGLLSTHEALWYGVPVLGFPVFADQPQNAIRLTNMGVGEKLSILDFTEDELFESIRKLMVEPKYQEKIKVISSALRDQPKSPIDEATYWVEWVLRHPEIDLRSPSINLSFFVRHSLDVFVIFILVILIGFLLWLKLIKYTIRVYRYMKRESTDKKKKQN